MAQTLTDITKKKNQCLFVFRSGACRRISQYTIHSDTSVAGGNPRPDLTTRASCLEACDPFYGCRGIGWAPRNNPSCWTHFDSFNGRPHPGVTHYEIRGPGRCICKYMTHSDPIQAYSYKRLGITCLFKTQII